MKYGIVELHDLYNFDAPCAYKELVQCRDCIYRCTLYCVMEDKYRPKGDDFCSWGRKEKGESK